MKIIHVVPYIYPAMVYGGPAKLVFQLALEQKRQNDDVSILTSDSFNSHRRFTKQEIINSNKEIKVIFSKNIINRIAYNNRLFTHFGIIKEYLLKFRDSDLFHIHDIYILPQILLMYLLILFKKRFVISPHGVLDPIRTKDKNLIKNILFILIKPCFNRAKFIIATSDQEKKQLSLLFPHLKDKLKTIWNGVENPKVNIVKSKSNKIRLLYIGKLHHKKGLSKFIKALNSFSNHEKLFELTIAGPDDGDKENIDQLIDQLGIKIKRLNFVDENQKIKLYQNHDIFIHPSESEGFSISIIEALSYGMPIFVTKACNFKKDDLINSGFLIEDNKINSICHGLKDILKNKEKLNHFSNNARELFVKKYTMTSMVKNIDQIIHNSFFGIKISTNLLDKTFQKAFNLYFPKSFGNLYPNLNKDQEILINFSNSEQIKLNNNLTKLSSFIGINKDCLEVKHDYLTTQTKISYQFDKELINKVDVSFKTTFLFDSVNLLLNNLLKKNLFKQIVKKYIQHPLLLDITNQNNLNCLHASAVEKDGKVIALVGMNSVGKSTLLSNYLNKGYKLFSDNYLLIDSKGKAFRYPSQIRLDKQHIEVNQNPKEFGYGKLLVSGNLSDLEDAQIKEVRILQRGKQKSVSKISTERAVQLINNLQVIDNEDIRYSVTQLIKNNLNPLKFNDNISFYINTVKNNE